MDQGPRLLETQADLVPTDTWPRVDGYRCLHCGGPARRHPAERRLWGCRECGLVTASPAVFFEAAPPLDKP